MPIYEYKCEHCDHELEALQKMSDAPLTQCPECKEPKLKKLVSASRFVLKGQGWYETDFKQKKTQPTDKPADKKEDTNVNTETKGNKSDKPAATRQKTKTETNNKTTAKTTPSAST